MGASEKALKSAERKAKVQLKELVVKQRIEKTRKVSESFYYFVFNLFTYMRMHTPTDDVV